MILDWIQIILAICLLWPRGYILIYLIDRSKSFSFGFKFFTGWLFGIGAFTLDVFGANVFGGFELQPWIFLTFAIGQIFALEIMVFILERKIIYPRFRKFKKFRQRLGEKFSSQTKWEKIALLILVLTILFRVSTSLWQVINIPTYDFDAWNNWNLRAKVIHTEQTIPLEKMSTFYLGGGIKSYPLNDSLFKVWLATAAGSWQDQYVNFVSIFYYLMLLAIFYFSLPSKMNRLLKIFATYLLSSLPLVVFHSHVPYADLLFSIFLFLTISCIFYWLIGRGNSFFYLSGIALAFGIWTKNEGLAIILPLMLITTIFFFLSKRIKFKQLFFYWFWGILTTLPWLSFRFINRLDFLSGDSSTVKLVFNSQFFVEIFSSIFLRSHFNFLWLFVFVIIILKAKIIWKNFSLRYLTSTLIILFLIYNSIIFFTDKAYDLSALTRVNMQLAPLGILFLVFFFRQFFVKMNLYGKK